MSRLSPPTTFAAAILLAAVAQASAMAQGPSGLPEPIPDAPPLVPKAGMPTQIGPGAWGTETSGAIGSVRREGVFARWRRHRHRAGRHLQESVLGFPEEFEEPALGHFVYAHGRAQVANADAAQMVLHDYDFVPGTDQLNFRGSDRLSRVARQMPLNFFPLVIERTPHTPGLDQLRRRAVLARLATGPFPVPDHRVVIGPAIARDLAGMETEMTHQNLMIQTMSNGALGGVGGGAIGGTAGQGFGAQGRSQPSQPR